MSTCKMVHMEFVTRAQWGARPPKSSRTLTNPTHLTYHWRGNPPVVVPPSLESESRAVRAIQTFHMVTRGWADIAYSGVIGQSGNWYDGRGWDIRTAAQGTNPGNSTSHAFMFLIGPGQAPSDKALETAAHIYETAVTRYPSVEAVGHRDWKATQCPGDDVYQWILDGGYDLCNCQPEIQALQEDITALQASIEGLRTTFQASLEGLREFSQNNRKAIQDELRPSLKAMYELPYQEGT